MKRDPLMWAALVAALVVTASAEYDLARSAGFGTHVAAGVPAALDIYAVRALRARRDVAAVVLAMVAVNAASHLVAAELLPVSVYLVVAVSAIAPLVLWRVHRLAEHIEQVPEPAAELTETPSNLDEVPPEPANLLDVIQEVPAEPAPEPVTLERVTEQQIAADNSTSTVADLRPALTLGPMVPVAEPLAGTGREQGGWTSFAGTKPSPEPAGTSGKLPEVPAEPAPVVPEPEPEPQHGSAETGTIPPNVAIEHIEAVRNWLAAEPELTGTAIGIRLGKSDSYGRRIRRAALTP